MTSLRSPVHVDVVAAQKNLRGHVVVTPLLESPELSERAGGRLLFKAESLQRTGSYKFRGAYHRLSQLDDESRRRGIVAFSTGNFGQAVACAAKLLQIPATIVVPQDAPAIKVNNCRSYGATVVFYDRAKPNHREELARDLAEQHQLSIIPPGDDPWVIAGYGTCGLELLEQFPEPIDALLSPCGGGGLSAGIALALEARQPQTQIFTVEPAGFEDTARSLAQGERVGNAPGPRSICDAILSPIPAELPFRTLRARMAGGLVVEDAWTQRAMASAFQHLKLVLEPAGAIALAAVLAGNFDCRGKTVAVICSGASVDAAVFRRALEFAEEPFQ